MNFWETKRLRLRALASSDAEHIIRWNLDSDRARHLDFLWPPQSADRIQTWLAEQTQKALEDDSFHWLIETLEGEPIGSIRTHNCDLRNGTFSYGLDIAREHQRKGYAFEVIRLILRYYFFELRYQKVTVSVHGNNLASIKLHERLGYQLEGRLRRMLFTQGDYIDLLWFGLTREAFEAQLTTS